MVSIWSILRWQRAADELELTRSRNLKAESLQLLMHDQITHNLDFLSGVPGSANKFMNLQEVIQKELAALRKRARTDIELDHIEGLEETHVELTWIGKLLVQSLPASISKSDRDAAWSRTREIADEVIDDIAALKQFYNTEVQRLVDDASSAGQFAGWVIAAAVLVALGQLLAMVFLSHRWLVRPIQSVNETTGIISTGNLDAQIDWDTDDEWGSLARSINNMVGSLKKLQHELRNQERLATMGEIVAYTAHNLRNPLAAIRAAAQVTINELSETSNEAKETLTDIVKTVDRMDVWMKGLLKLASPTTLRLEAADLNILIEEVIEITQTRFSEYNVQVRLELEQDLPLVMVDSSLIQQVISVLVTNAIESGGDTVTVSTVYNGTDNNKYFWTFAIQDNGKGVPPELKPRLFKAFVTSKSDGTGLGLAQAKKIVELHQGDVQLFSETGKGTTVTVCLPSNPQDSSRE
jgi:signal transduction histidine kinase